MVVARSPVLVRAMLEKQQTYYGGSHMKYWNALLPAALLALAINPSQAQDAMPPLGSVENWGCQMNEGKSASDLMKVVDDWNEWADDNELDAYTAWIMNPIFKSDADFVREAGWFGYSPNFTEAGKGLQAWMTNGKKLNERFNDVWTCSWHSEFATMLVRPPADGPSSAIVSFSDCSLNEGVTPADLMAATAKWNAYLDEQEVMNAIAYHFPGHGNPADMTADMKVSIWRPSLESYGRDADLYVNGGGLQANDAIFGEVMSCDSARMYAATLIRGGQAQ